VSGVSDDRGDRGPGPRGHDDAYVFPSSDVNALYDVNGHYHDLLHVNDDHVLLLLYDGASSLSFQYLKISFIQLLILQS
jgi:hypothetical protein